MLRFLRYLGLALLAAVVAAFAAGWWVVHRALPQLDGVISLPELRNEVTVTRDKWGVPHIRASSAEDALTAQGYVMAQDRLFQMDLIRRVAAGELSEVIGPATLALDRENRTLGLRVAAERDAALMSPEMRGMLEAYARGVNRFLEEHRHRLPWECVALRYQPRTWTPVDTLLIGAYMYKTLTTTWRWELHRAKVTERVGPERAAELYVVDSPLDRFIVGEPQTARKHAESRPAYRSRTRDPRLSYADNSDAELAVRSAQAILQDFENEAGLAAGSNNWVVDGRHTASGKPLLANDTHLPLGVPCLWYIVHVTAPGWNVKGFALPGTPMITIGMNDRIAWGFTNSGADVQDLYLETLNPANPLEYRVNGQWVAARVRQERIQIKGQPDETLDVIVTRHGPIVEREGGRAYALRWTATEPGGLLLPQFLLGRTQNWEEFLSVMRQVSGPAQNTVYADVAGNIGFLVPARIPIRRKGDGSVPVPGDTDDYEWTGFIPFDELPKVLNPPEGIIATANARTVGPTYAHFITTRWVSPYRTARIYELLEARKNFRPPDFIAIQADLVSLPDRFLATELLKASRRVQPKDPRARDLIGRLKGWDARATADSVEMTFVEYTRRALMERLLRPYLGDDWRMYEWFRDEVFLETTLAHEPKEWLPKEFSSYAEFLMACADDAVRRIERIGGANPAGWRWGGFFQLEIPHPLVKSGWLSRVLGIGVGPVEQPGARNTVKQTGRSFGPSERFVADMSNPDHSLMNLTLGESGQLGSAHYRDQFHWWFIGQGVAAPFSEAGEEKARVHRLRLVPAGKQ